MTQPVLLGRSKINRVTREEKLIRGTTHNFSSKRFKSNGFLNKFSLFFYKIKTLFNLMVSTEASW